MNGMLLAQNRRLSEEEILKGMPAWYPKLREIYNEFLKEEALKAKYRSDALQST